MKSMGNLDMTVSPNDEISLELLASLERYKEENERVSKTLPNSAN
jgi:hypothetical protein